MLKNCIRQNGIFATRYPYHPNPIGILTIRFLSHQDNTLTIEGVDVLDGTPLLNIKSYVSGFEAQTDTRNGWYTAKNK